MSRATLQFADFVLDLGSGDLLLDGRSVAIAALPRRLLRYLAANRHRFIPKAELLGEVWGGVRVEESSLHQALKQVRHAVGDTGRRQEVIKTASGLGYRFVADALERRPDARVAAGSYVGRRSLCRDLEQRVDDVVAGRGGVILLGGEPGIGKTRTCDEIASYAATRGLLEIRGGGDPRAGAPSYWPWIEIFRELARSRPVEDLRRGARALLDPAAEVEAPDLGEAERFRTFDIASRCLTRAAALGPVVAVLEDLHEASAATLELLTFIARAIARHPILFVATYRQPELSRDPSRAHVFSQLVSIHSVEVHELTALSEHETAYLIEQRAERALPAPLVRTLARRSAGNPLFAVELARLLSDSSETLEEATRDYTEKEWEKQIPRGAGRLLADRLAALTPATRQGLRVAAAIGSSFDPGLLGRVEPAVSESRFLEESLESRLVVGAPAANGFMRFSHALIRDALYEELAERPEQRREVHLRIAESLLGEEHPHEAEVAFHLCEAAPLGGIRRTVSYVRRAAQRALSVGDADAAWTLYRKACGLLEREKANSSLRCEFLVEAGEIGVNGPDRERARGILADAILIARELDDGELFCRAALAQSFHSVTVSESDAAVVALLEEGLRRLGDGPQALRSQMLARLAREVIYQPGGMDRALELTDDAIVHAHRSQDSRTLANVLEDVTFVRWSGADPAGWLALNEEIVSAATRAGDADLRFRGLKGLATVYLEMGDLPSAERETTRCEQAAAEYPSPYLHHISQNMRASYAFLRGDFEAGERSAIEAASSGLAAAETAAAAQIYYHRMETGRASELEAPLHGLIAVSPGIRAWRFALARVLVDGGRNDEAREVIASAGKLAGIPRDRNWLIGMALLAECLVCLNDEPLAEEVFEALRPHAKLNVVLGNGSLFHGNTSHFLGMLAAHTTRQEQARTFFESALSMHERMKAVPWVIRTQLEQADLLGRMGDPERARNLAAAANVAARSIGMPRYAARADAILGRIR